MLNVCIISMCWPYCSLYCWLVTVVNFDLWYISLNRSTIWLTINPSSQVFKIFYCKLLFLKTRYSLFNNTFYNNACYTISSKPKLVWSYPVKPMLIIKGNNQDIRTCNIYCELFAMFYFSEKIKISIISSSWLRTIVSSQPKDYRIVIRTIVSSQPKDYRILMGGFSCNL
jgi:hypothetical protein